MAPTPQAQPRTLHQNFIDTNSPPILQQTLLEAKLTEELLDDFLRSAPMFPNPIRIGIAPAYNVKDQLAAIALATESKVLVVQLGKNKKVTPGSGRELLLTKVLCNPDCILYTFGVAQVALSLYLDHDLRILNGVNIESICPESKDNIVSPLAAVTFAVGDQWRIYEDNVKTAFQDVSWDSAKHTPLALKAWLASFLPAIPGQEEQFNTIQRVNTKDQSDGVLAQIAQMVRADQRLASQRPGTIANEFSAPSAKQQRAKVKSARFQNRIQKSSEVRVTVQDEHGAMFVVDARTGSKGVIGRDAILEANNTSLEGKTILSITTIDGGRATMAEQQKALHLLRALQGQLDLFESPFQKYIWCPGDAFTWPETFESSDEVPEITATQLNDSQQRAVHHMLSNSNSTRVTVIQGPPGTGKTSVIAAFVCSAIAGGRKGIWLVAQTNVAVKNIAEKLAKVGFLDWKLLVSADFHLGWHEHLYTAINKNIISSDLFFKKAGELIGDCSVILCTLSMLSSSYINKFTARVPLTTLVVDEASQISINDYIPALQQFPSLRKMCFIGDDKQLPPFGQEQTEELKSIFEVPHLRLGALMLNIQYRMPPHLGDFISEAVYDAQLASNPLHPVKKPESYFVDVAESHEQRDGTSWMNTLERQTVLKIAAKFQEEDKEYKIITPYDAQRSLLEHGMKEMGLIWQDKCFNVDSFQGNEEDYIIISLVRTHELGFLTDLRRTNVMLTRCKRGMIICSKWDFVMGVAANTLVGQMAKDWGIESWKAAWEWDEPEEA